MTEPVVELFERDVTDVERLVIAHLSPLEYRTAIERRAGDPLPFVIVTELTATEDGQQMDAYPLVSVHVLGSSRSAVKTDAAEVHRRMLMLAGDPLQDITLADDSVASILWLETVERPSWRYYSDTVLQKVSRYRIALPFTDIEE